MSKYLQELKMKVIKYCIEEYHSYVEAARNFKVKDIKAISK